MRKSNICTCYESTLETGLRKWKLVQRERGITKSADAHQPVLGEYSWVECLGCGKVWKSRAPYTNNLLRSVAPRTSIILPAGYVALNELVEAVRIELAMTGYGYMEQINTLVEMGWTEVKAKRCLNDKLMALDAIQHGFLVPPTPLPGTLDPSKPL